MRNAAPRFDEPICVETAFQKRQSSLPQWTVVEELRQLVLFSQLPDDGLNVGIYADLWVLVETHGDIP